MESLQFGNLPLVRVTMNVHFQEHIRLDLDLACKLRNELKAGFPHVEDFAGSQALPFLAPLERESKLVLRGDNGTQLDMTPLRTSLTWDRSTGEPYPRYQLCAAMLERAVSILPELNVSFLNMTYTNLIADGKVGTRYFQASLWPAAGTSKIKDYNIAWELESGVEFRVQLTFPEDKAVLSTAGGMAAPLAWRKNLDLVHAEMQSEFRKLLSDEAKKEWQLQ